MYKPRLGESFEQFDTLRHDTIKFHHINVIVSLVLLSIACILCLSMTADTVTALIELTTK